MVTIFVVKKPGRKRSHPISNILYTASILDDRRLGKQRVEAKQIIDALERGSGGWINHPATAAWRYYSDSSGTVPEMSGTVPNVLGTAQDSSIHIPDINENRYLPALKLYHDIMIRTWLARGKNNNMMVYYTDDEYLSMIKGIWKNSIDFPAWCSIDAVQYSHMARLVQKDPIYYKPIFTELPAEYLEYGYIWPAKWSDTDLYTRPVGEIAEPFVDYPICSAVYANGNPCRNKATRGDLCGVHGEKVEKIVCTGTFANGNPCTYTAKYGDRCGRHR